MRAPAAGVPGGAQRFAGTGELGQLVGVRLDEVGAGGDAAAQGFAAGVEQGGYPGGAGDPDQVRVRADVDAGRQAAAEGDRVGPVEEFAVRPQEGVPLVGADVRSGLVELGGVAGGAVHDGDGAPGAARHLDEGVGGAVRERGEQVAQDGSGGAPGEARDHGVVAQQAEHPGHVDALAAGTFGHLADPVAGVRDEGGDAVGQVERGVQRDGQYHPHRLPVRS